VGESKGLWHRSPFAFCLVIVVDDGLAAITVSIFLLNHGLAVMWLPLLNHGGMIAVTVAVLIMRLANRYASADRTDANTNFVRQHWRRDNANHGGSE
jgi:hypothetical protein